MLDSVNLLLHYPYITKNRNFMSIFERTENENNIMVSKKIVAAWIVAVDNEINTLDIELYNSMFPEKKDLKSIVKKLSIGSSDIPEACSHLSAHYKNNSDEALLFLQFLINLSFTGKTVYPYEKIILDCLRGVLGLEEIVLSHEFEKLTKLSFFPIGNVSSKAWWEDSSSLYSQDFNNFYSTLRLEHNCTSKEIRLKLQLKNVLLSNQDIDDIEYILLNPKRKETYNKYLLYSDVIKNIQSYKNDNSIKEPHVLLKKNINVKTSYLWATSLILILLSLANFKYDFIRLGVPDPQPIEIINNISATTPTKEIIINSQVKKYINTSKLHLRSGPGLNFDILIVLSEGQIVTINKEIGGWSEVIDANGAKGWMATTHLATFQ